MVPLRHFGDAPVVGNWDGRGNDRLGIFRDGVWRLDANGDGDCRAKTKPCTSAKRATSRSSVTLTATAPMKSASIVKDCGFWTPTVIGASATSISVSRSATATTPPSSAIGTETVAIKSASVTVHAAEVDLPPLHRTGRYFDVAGRPDVNSL